MNKIFVEDFYDLHPTTLLAGKSFSNGYKNERVTVRLHSEVDYEKEELSYTVSEELKGGVLYWHFDSLDNAVNCYNERLRINTNCS